MLESSMNHNLLDLSGRIIVVAGAGGGGLGTAVTRLAAQSGATVVGVSRRQENLDEYLAPMIEEGLSVVPVAADLETDEGVATVMDVVRKTEGDLHGLVAVIGGGPPPTWGPATRISRSDWRDLFTKNLESMFFISQAVAAELKAQNRKGSLVAISSITAIGAQPLDRKSTRLNSSHVAISYAVF